MTSMTQSREKLAFTNLAAALSTSKWDILIHDFKSCTYSSWVSVNHLAREGAQLPEDRHIEI